MKADSIMGRRRLLHSIYDTIDHSFKQRRKNQDKDIMKTQSFIESLKKLTTNFTSKGFLKKPLKDMLDHFKDPSWLDESDEEDLFPLLMEGKRSKRKIEKTPQSKPRSVSRKGSGESYP